MVEEILARPVAGNQEVRQSPVGHPGGSQLVESLQAVRLYLGNRPEVLQESPHREILALPHQPLDPANPHLFLQAC